MRRDRSLLERHALGIALLALVLVFGAANRDYLSGRAFPLYDADGFFAPFYMFVADLARHGRLLTWNPFVNAGSPDFADPQVGAFDPLVLLFGLVTGSHVLGFLVYWLAMWAAAGAGILLLARRLGCDMPLALVVALGFTFSGFFLGHAQHTSFVRSFAFLGLILWRLDVALGARRLRPALESGVLWGLSGLGGYPALLFLNLLAAGAWTTLRLFCLEEDADPSGAAVPRERLRWPGRSELRHALTALALLVGTGALVLLPTYLGTLVEAAEYTSRAGALPRQEAIESNALHPRALGTFASPYLGVLPKQRLWDYTDGSSCNTYLGALTLLLAVFALVVRPLSLWRWALLAAAGFAVCTALSRDLPLRGWLYDWVPPTRYFRHASACRSYALFFVAVLALVGARDLVCTRVVSPSRRKAWTSTVVFLAAAAGLALLAVTRFDALTRLARVQVPEEPRQQLYAMWIGAPLCIAAAWLLRDRARARLVPIAAMIGLASLDAFLCMELSEPIMRNPPERVAELWAELERNEPRSFELLGGTERGHISNASAGLGPGFNSKNMLRRQPMYRSYTTLSNEIHLDWDKDPRAWQAYAGKERTYFAERVGRGSPDRPADLQAFQRRAKRLELPPIVIEGDVEGGGEAFEAAPIAELPAAVRVEPTIREYGMRTLAFDVTAPSDGWLLVTDRWARSWTARVDGASARIWKGNFLFRALRVHAGVNSVEFRYQPFGFPWLTYLSWLVTAGVLASTAASWWARRSRTEPPASHGHSSP